MCPTTSVRLRLRPDTTTSGTGLCVAGVVAKWSHEIRMPFVYSHLAVMPDVHVGKGATVGSVIATRGAIIPAAVGVDIGCGRTTSA
jgi:RNA-splicing ligase RtcB